MPQPGAYSFRRKWEDENEETAVMLLQADWNATPQCFSSIRRSWERCRELGLFRAHPARLELLEQEELERRKDQHIFFVHLAANELNILRRAIAGTSGMALLADPQGTILDGRGDSGFVGKAKRISLRPGSTWSEVLEGTNAIGTALVEQQHHAGQELGTAADAAVPADHDRRFETSGRGNQSVGIHPDPGPDRRNTGHLRGCEESAGARLDAAATGHGENRALLGEPAWRPRPAGRLPSAPQLAGNSA